MSLKEVTIPFYAATRLELNKILYLLILPDQGDTRKRRQVGKPNSKVQNQRETKEIQEEAKRNRNKSNNKNQEEEHGGETRKNKSKSKSEQKTQEQECWASILMAF